MNAETGSDASSTRPAAAPSGGVAVFEQRRFSRSLGASVVPALAWAKLGELDALLERVNGLYEEAVAELARAREQGHAQGFAEGIAAAEPDIEAAFDEQLLVLAEAGELAQLGDGQRAVPDLAMTAPFVSGGKCHRVWLASGKGCQKNPRMTHKA